MGLVVGFEEAYPGLKRMPKQSGETANAGFAEYAVFRSGISRCSRAPGVAALLVNPGVGGVI